MSGQPNDSARSVVRTRRLEEVTETGESPRAQEARLLQVEAAANTAAATTYEQLVIFHQQQQALAHEMSMRQEKQEQVAREVVLRQRQQDEMAVRLEQQQAVLTAQQATFLTKLAEQERTTKEHEKALHHVSNVFGAYGRSPRRG